MGKIDECDMEEFGALLLDSSEKTIAILGGRWWPQAAKQPWDETTRATHIYIYIYIIRYIFNTQRQLRERSTVTGVSIRSRNGVRNGARNGVRNGAPSRKGYMVNRQKSKASNE